MSSSRRVAALAIQYALQAAGVRVSADGIVGPKTQKAIDESTSPSIRAIATEHAAALKPMLGVGQVFVSQAEMDAGIALAVAKYGAEVEPFLREMVVIEGRAVPGGVLTEFGGTYRGLGQIARATWDDIAGRIDSSIGSYDENVTNSSKNLMASAAYYTSNKRVYDKLARVNGWSKSFSAKLGYLFHQQGPGGGPHFLLTGKLKYPKQSAPSIAVMAQARYSVV